MYLMATEIEMLTKAKMYMEKLASGVDPISGNLAPEEDVINQLRLSRCFTYVAGVLQEVIDNGGKVAKASKGKKLPFYLPLAEREKFQFSDSPIPVTEITDRINSLIDTDTMSKMKHNCITLWLMNVGLLEERIVDNNKIKKLPTSEGEAIGIIVRQGVGTYGPYTYSAYNRNAQQFLIDNIDTITEINNTKPRDRESVDSLWSPEYDECLIDLSSKNVPVSEIAVTLKKSNSAVIQRMKKLGLM